MPRNNLIIKFFEEIRDKYPHLSFDQINEACLFPYMYFKRRMSDDDIPDIRIKYLGSWQVYSKPILSKIKKIEDKFERRNREGKVIYPNEIQELEKLKNYVKNNPQVFCKVGERRNTKN